MNTTKKKQIALPIIVASLVSSPFFISIGLSAADPFPFLWKIIDPFDTGGCGGLIMAPLLALLISLFTGCMGWIVARFVLKIQKGLVLIGLLCGFIAGFTAGLIWPPTGC